MKHCITREPSNIAEGVVGIGRGRGGSGRARREAILLRTLVAPLQMAGLRKSILSSFASLDDDRRFRKQLFLVCVAPGAPCLAEAAADAFFGQDNRSEISRIFNRSTASVHFGANSCELV